MMTNNVSSMDLELTGQVRSHLTWLTPEQAIHKEMKTAWQALTQAAKQDGLTLCIASGFRSFERQLSIWNRKFTGQLPVKNQLGENCDLTSMTNDEKVHAIMLYSALPGASRHHFGSDIDIYDPTLLPQNKTLQLEAWEYQKNGYFYPLTLWLNQHMHKFGFYRPYQVYNNGIAPEPWHISYIPLAREIDDKLNLSVITCCLNNCDIEGKETILKLLPSLYQRYITNTAKIHSEY